MIEFKGELSGSSKMRLLKDLATAYFVVMLLPTFIFGGFALIIALGSHKMYIFWITMIALIFLCVFFTLYPIIFTKIALKNTYKSIVVDNDDKFIYINFKKKFDNHTFSIRFDEITKVIETEEYYYIKTEFKICGYVCQKDLITEGSIEEFEEIFNDLIVKKFE